MASSSNSSGFRNIGSVNHLCWGNLSILILLLGLFSTPAAAASFDCQKAATWLEKKVCSNAELSKLDGEIVKCCVWSEH